MDCLKEIICGNYALVGVRDFVHCPHPETILYIQDVPGITLKSAAAIVNDEQRGGIQLLNDKIILATKKVFHKFSHIVSGSFNFNEFIVSRELRDFSNITNPPATLERGLSLTRWKSEMARIYIDTLFIKVEESGIANIMITDGDITKIYVVSLLAGVTNEVSIRYTCESENVLVTFDQTNFTTFQCDIDDESGCRRCGTYRTSNSDFKIMGWDGTEEVDTCFGMGILANIQCMEQAIICQLLPRMAFMILYQSAIEIFNEQISSGRTNPVTTFGNDQAAISRDQAIIDLAEEEKQFNKNINTFLKNTRGDCFACSGSRYAYALPG